MRELEMINLAEKFHQKRLQVEARLLPVERKLESGCKVGGGKM